MKLIFYKLSLLIGICMLGQPTPVIAQEEGMSKSELRKQAREAKKKAKKKRNDKSNPAGGLNDMSSEEREEQLAEMRKDKKNMAKMFKEITTFNGKPKVASKFFVIFGVDDLSSEVEESLPKLMSFQKEVTRIKGQLLLCSHAAEEDSMKKLMKLKKVKIPTYQLSDNTKNAELRVETFLPKPGPNQYVIVDVYGEEIKTGSGIPEGWIEAIQEHNEAELNKKSKKKPAKGKKSTDDDVDNE